MNYNIVSIYELTLIIYEPIAFCMLSLLLDSYFNYLLAHNLSLYLNSEP